MALQECVWTMMAQRNHIPKDSTERKQFTNLPPVPFQDGGIPEHINM